MYKNKIMVKPKSLGNIIDNKRHVFKYTAIVGLLLIGVVVPAVSIVTAGTIALYILGEKNIAEVKYLFVFLIPLAAIFKYGPETTSFVTILMLVGIVRFVSSRVIDKDFFIAYLLFSVFCVVAIPTDTITAIKQMMIPLFVYYFLRHDEDFDKCTAVKVYIASVLVASIIGLLKGYIPHLANYVVDKSLRVQAGVYANRFSGLNGDPNYYSVNILLSFVLTVYLLIKKKLSTIIGVVLITAFVVFGAYTNSKSFIAILACAVAFAIISSINNKNYLLAFAFIIATLIGVIQIINGRLGIFTLLIQRFQSGKSISDLTTGRSGYFVMYLDYIREHIKVLLVGNGISSALLNGVAPHNTYIDFIYYYGVIGTFIWLCMFRSSIKRYCLEKNIVYYLPMIVILIAYLFLSELKYMDFQLHVSIVLMMLCNNYKKASNTNNGKQV